MRPATPRPRAPPPPPSATPLRPSETSTPPSHGISSGRGPAPAQHANPPAGSTPAKRPPPPMLRPPPQQQQQWPPLPTGPPPGTTGHEPPVGHVPPAGSYAPSQCGAASHSPFAMPMQPFPPAQQLHMHGGWGAPQPFFTQPFCDSAGQLYSQPAMCLQQQQFGMPQQYIMDPAVPSFMQGMAQPGGSIHPAQWEQQAYCYSQPAGACGAIPPLCGGAGTYPSQAWMPAAAPQPPPAPAPPPAPTPGAGAAPPHAAGSAPANVTVDELRTLLNCASVSGATSPACHRRASQLPLPLSMT